MTTIILLSMAGLLAVLLMLVLATKTDGRSRNDAADNSVVDSGDGGGADGGGD